MGAIYGYRYYVNVKAQDIENRKENSTFDEMYETEVILSELISWKIRRLLSFKTNQLAYNGDESSFFATHKKNNNEISCKVT